MKKHFTLLSVLLLTASVYSGEVVADKKIAPVAPKTAVVTEEDKVEGDEDQDLIIMEDDNDIESLESNRK